MSGPVTASGAGRLSVLATMAVTMPSSRARDVLLASSTREMSMLIRLLWVGAFAGAAAGIVYILMAELLVVLAYRPVDTAFRFMASILLGERAFSAVVSVTDAILIGTLVAMVLSVAFGMMFGVLVARFPGLAATPGTLVVAGATFGGALWLLNVAVLGTLFWPWFWSANLTLQFLAMTVGYGTSLGAFFALAGVHRPAELE